jgi:hypothetical protein
VVADGNGTALAGGRKLLGFDPDRHNEMLTVIRCLSRRDELKGAYPPRRL